MKGLMNYSVEMGSRAIIYIPSFIKIGSDIEKLIGGDTHTDREVISKGYFPFFYK
jgi:hypothetical protein